MNAFFWESGHLGWGVFTLAVFSGAWVLAVDLYWRLKTTRVTSLVAASATGWPIGAGLIVLGFWLANR
jgi:hypothetical protein